MTELEHPRAKKAKGRMVVPLPEEGKEKEKEKDKEREIQVDLVAVRRAAVRMAAAAQKEDRRRPEQGQTRQPRRVEEPPHQARKIELCASTTLRVVATKEKNANSIIQRFASTTRRENAKRVRIA